MAQRKIKIRGVYRSGSHLPLWEVLEEADIWDKAGLDLAGFEYCAMPPDAEAALFKGDIDFISGDHLTPYGLVVKGKPIVSIASPVNGQNACVASREPLNSIQDLRGKRIADTPMEGRDGGFHHGRGNHMMYLIRAGIGIDQVRWVEDESSDAQQEALKSGKADARFISANAAERYKGQGFHVLALGPLPMINGPTLTTSYTVLHKKKELGERLVKALVLGIHFAKTKKDKTEKILANLSKKKGDSFEYRVFDRMPKKPYPDPQGIINAYELGCIKAPEAKQLSPLALWDLHYLRELDNSGFIDKLYRN
ncbi:MAG TPA: ABC transporter substrate-binding protein [Verrucomicrobiae bacterium]|jgi:ABC-type nitrate/sulfonate/bicarbonate transport system substrate-binding protein|nr:ABC transporter substrate-binding protein [Verrucomicrobiae bacterium]